MDYYLGSQIGRGTVIVVNTVFVETTRKVFDIFSKVGQEQKIPPIATRVLIQKSLQRFQRLLGPGRYNDSLKLMSSVKQMYADIWADDSKTEKKTEWAKHKHLSVEKGPPRGNDLIILSTAGEIALGANVELLTLDHDFITFQDEIKAKLNVTITNGWSIPNS